MKTDGGLTLGIIAKNNADFIRRVEEEMHPLTVVDEVILTDTGSTDGTPEFAESLGWTVNHFVWCDDFSAARNANLEACKTRWYVWMDTDDVIENFERLPAAIAAMSDKALGLVCDYIYHYDKHGNPTIVISRERVVDREAAKWQWHGILHEVLMPDHDGGWIENHDILWRHYPIDRSAIAHRNLELLQKAIHKEPNNVRTMFYLGCQYNAVMDHARSIAWFKRYLAVAGWDEEAWRAAELCADNLRALARKAGIAGNKEREEELLGEAIEMNLMCIEILPGWADAWFGLAESYIYKREWGKALWWHEEGLRKERCNPRIFQNPLDYTFNPFLFSHIARRESGDAEGALGDVNTALAIVPDDQDLLQQKARYEELLQEKALAAAAVTLAQTLSPMEALRLDRLVPDAARRFAHYRRDVLGKVAHWRDGLTPVVDFFCGQGGLEPWGPPILDETGIGGSETAVIRVAAELAKKGIRVRVLGNPGKYAGIYDGVEYWDWHTYPTETPRDVLVIWRTPQAISLPWKAKLKLFWAHDLNYGPQLYGPDPAAGVDCLCGVSQWHADYLEQTYPTFRGKVRVLRNGIHLDYYNKPGVERDPHKAIWSSSPDRGLVTLLSMMDYLTQVDPDLKVHVFYGMNNLEALGRAGSPAAIEMLASLRGTLKEYEKYIVWRGRVPQKVLAEEQRSASWWLFPTRFPEISCISAIEAQAAGLHIVTSDMAALPETLNGAGHLIPGSSTHPQYQRMFIGMTSWLMGHPEEDDVMRRKGWANAISQTWSHVVAQDWLPLIGDALG